MDSKDEQRILQKEITEKGNKIKEKEILKQLKVQKGKELTPNNLKIAKEQRLGKLRYKNVKLEKCIKKRKRKQDNQKEFFKTLERHQTREGKCLRWRNLSNLLVVFAKKKERTPNITWIDEVKRLLGEVTIINELEIDTEKLTKEINKRKNWTVLGIDGVQNFWRKKLVAAQKALLSA